MIDFVIEKILKKIQEENVENVENVANVENVNEYFGQDITEISGWDIFWFLLKLFFACWAVRNSWTCYKFQDYSTWYRVFLAVIAFLLGWMYLIFDYFYCSVPSIEKATQALRKAERRAEKAEIRDGR